MEAARTATHRRVTRFAALATLAGLLLLLGPTSPASGETMVGGIVVRDASPAEIDLISWAVARYRAARLDLPALTITFHPTSAGCGGETGLGLYKDGHIDLCPGMVINVMTRHTVLHEMAHAWTEQHDDPAVIGRFLQARRLPTWDSWDYPWLSRGWEQAADIVAWGIGERIVSPRVPDASPDELSHLFRLLTGTPLPAAVG